MPPKPSIFAIVLAWNFIDDSRECLESLLKTTYPNFHVIVVDNGSTDGTTEILKDNFPTIDILTLPENIGIARGYNEGIKYANQNGADYFLIMNNDTVVSPSMVNNLLQSAQEDSTIGIAMPKIYHYYGEQNRLWCAGARWRSFPPRIKLIGADKIDSPTYSKRFDIDYAPSCCLLIKKSVFAKVGLMDPNYFFYFDDWDFSERVRKAGYKLIFEPSASMWHKDGQSTRKTDKPSKWWFIYGQSSVRFFFNHKTSSQLIFHSVWIIFREIIKLKVSKILPIISGIFTGISIHRNWTQIRILSIPTLDQDE